MFKLKADVKRIFALICIALRTLSVNIHTNMSIEQNNLVFQNDNERLKEAIAICKKSEDPHSLICSDSVSFNAASLDEANE